VSELTDEQVEEGLAEAAAWLDKPKYAGPTYERFARLALAFRERLEAAEKLKCPDRSDFVALQERLQAAEAERDEARMSAQDQSRAKCAAIERAENAERILLSARQQARREAFEEAAKKVLATRAVPEPLNNWWFGVRAELATAIRALAEGER
jgi:hypothetical protein